MEIAQKPFSKSYSPCIETSKRLRWDMDSDVIRDSSFEPDRKFLPDSITFIDSFDFLESREKVFLNRIQGRTYANMFGIFKRFIAAKILEQTSNFRLGNQIAMEALARFCDKEIKHQLLFHRIESMIQQTMPADYTFGRSARYSALSGNGTAYFQKE